MPKGIGTGILAGVIVWGVLFLPMHYYVIQPALSGMANESIPGNLDPSVAESADSILGYDCHRFACITYVVWRGNGILLQIGCDMI